MDAITDKGDRVQIVGGALLTALSLVAAFQYSYNHFYEILLAGLFLFLRGVKKTVTADRDLFLQTYIGFVFLGIAGELIAGEIAGLWRYSYISPVEYGLLFLFVYPFGGLVVVQTFEILTEGVSQSDASRFFNPSVLFLLGLVLVAGSYLSYQSGTVFILQPLTVFGLAVFVNALSEIRSGDSFQRRLDASTLENTTLLIAVTAIHAVVHEYPNVYAGQWDYIASPIMEIDLFGIPHLVLAGWLVLSVFPLSVFYDRKIALESRG